MKMGLVRRASCLFLAATCVFLTGCHSILYDGNLHFKSYEPETVPLIYDEVSNKVDTSNQELNAERFNIEGTDAFFILPCHKSDPDEIVDFKLLDYTNAGTFIYAYISEFEPGVDRSGGAMCGYPNIGQVKADGSIVEATIDMLGDRTAPTEAAAAGDDEEEETLPPPPNPGPVSESVDVKTESEAPSSSEAASLAAAEGASSGAEPAAEADTPEPKLQTFDPGELWWGTDAVSGTTPETAAETSRSDTSLWWDTGESEGFGYVDWSKTESEAASLEESMESSYAEEQASKEEAAGSSEDRSGWGDGSEPATDGTGAQIKETESSSPEDTNRIPVATVMMAYDPQRRVYKVFFADVSAKEAEHMTQMYTLEEEYTLTVSANKLAKAEQYFIFCNNIGYVYDRDGNQIISSDYTALIQVYDSEIQSKVLDEYMHNAGYDTDDDSWPKPGDDNFEKFDDFHTKLTDCIRQRTLTVSNVVMDGSYYAYIPVTFQMDDPSGESSADIDITGLDGDAADQAVLANSYQAVLVGISVDIGGSDPPVKFYSKNTAWEEQKAKWLSFDGTVIKDETVTEKTLDTYLKDNKIYSMEQIKKEIVPDKFEAFHTEDGYMGLSLAYLPDIFSFNGYLEWTEDSETKLYSVPMCLRQLYFYCSSYDTSVNGAVFSEGTKAEIEKGGYGDLTDHDSMKKMLWSEVGLATQIYSGALDALAQMAMGNMETLKNWLRDSLMKTVEQIAAMSNVRMLIPWMTPGAWNAEKGINECPVPNELVSDEADSLEAILACREVLLNSGSQYEGEFSQYVPITIGGDRDLKGRKITFGMNVVDYADTEGETELTRTFKQEIKEKIARKDASGNELKDASGNVIYDTKTTTNTYTQTLDLTTLPLKYQFIFMNGSKMSVGLELDTGAMTAPTGELGVILYEGEDTNTSSKMSISVAGTDVFSAGGIQGNASDAGILYHKDLSTGKETELLALITDEGVQFCRRSANSVAEGNTDISADIQKQLAGIMGADTGIAKDSGWAEDADESFFITSDEFATRTTNYGLSTISLAEFNNQNSANKFEGVTNEQNQVIRTKINSGSGMDALSFSRFTLLNDREVLVASSNEGLFAVNLKSHQAVSLHPGAFFAAVPYQKEGTEQFMVVGFDTTQYYYQPSDIVKAKCYAMDLAAENRDLENKALQAYLSTLANNYLIRTHRIEANGDGTDGDGTDGEGTAAPYINEAADDTEKAANEQARKLFFSTEASMQWELYQITQGAGFAYTQRILDYTTQLRQKLLTQREKLNEFYSLCGLGKSSDFLDSVTGMPKDVTLREQEGALIHANYTSTLEHALVTLKLSEDAIDGMVSNKNEYEEYRTQMLAAETAQNELNKKSQNEKSELVKSKDVADVSSSLSEDGLDYLEKTDFYRSVLSDVKKAYENGQSQADPVSWDDYILELLNGISPDNAVNQQERAFEWFCQLAQIDLSIMSEDQTEELRNRLNGINRVADLELLIVEYKLKTATYQSSAFQEEFQEFQDKTFEEESERADAVRKAGFYKIIQGLIADAQEQKLLDGTDWDSELNDIVSLCGKGIVLDPNVAELFTEEEESGSG